MAPISGNDTRPSPVTIFPRPAGSTRPAAPRPTVPAHDVSRTPGPDIHPGSGPEPSIPIGSGRHAASGGHAGSGHPAVDAALQAIANAAQLPPADQIAQYDAAHRTLRETLATIDQS